MIDDGPFLLGACKGNADAVRLCLDLVKITDIWDDLIDGDKLVSGARIDAAFMRMLVELPANDFFVAHRARLLPVMVSAILNWKIANAYEATGRLELLEISHNMRYGIFDVLLAVVTICGGWEWAAEVGPELRTRMQKDRLLPYLREHSKQLPESWPGFRPGFERSLGLTGGAYAIEDLERGVLNGSFKFWTDGKVAVLTEFITFPRAKALILAFVAGRMTRSAGDLYARIEAYAKANGCTQMRGGGRRGWLRFPMETKGAYRELGVLVAKEI